MLSSDRIDRSQPLVPSPAGPPQRSVSAAVLPADPEIWALAQGDPARRSVLVVDDDPAMRTLLVDAIGEDGYQVTGASDTLSALSYRLRSKVSLVVLDWKMPDLDGFVLLDSLRRIAPRMPVIFVTAYDQPEICRRALEAGARGFLAKPFPVSRLLAEIEKALTVPPGPARFPGNGSPAEEL